MSSVLFGICKWAGLREGCSNPSGQRSHCADVSAYSDAYYWESVSRRGGAHSRRL